MNSLTHAYSLTRQSRAADASAMQIDQGLSLMNNSRPETI